MSGNTATIYLEGNLYVTVINGGEGKNAARDAISAVTALDLLQVPCDGVISDVEITEVTAGNIQVH